MRRLIWVFCVLVLLWSVCWAVTAYLIRDSVANWVAVLRAQGWETQLTDLSVGGFPIGFRSTAASLALSDPASGLRVKSDAISLQVPAWWPGYATLTLPGERIALTSGQIEAEINAEDAQADARIRPGMALELESLRFESNAWDLQADNDQSASGSAMLATFVQDRDDPTVYAFNVNLEGLALGNQTRAHLAIPENWPYQLAASVLSGTLRFAEPLNKAALENGEPRLRRVEITTSQAIWGPVEVSAEGTVDIDNNGVPQGDIRLLVTNLQSLLNVTRAHNTAFAIQTSIVLSGLANVDGDPETLDVTLRFEEGQVSLGGIVLGPAPRIGLD